VILNTTTNRYEWNKGTDTSPDWQPFEALSRTVVANTLSAGIAALTTNSTLRAGDTIMVRQGGMRLMLVYDATDAKWYSNPFNGTTQAVKTLSGTGSAGDAIDISHIAKTLYSEAKAAGLTLQTRFYGSWTSSRTDTDYRFYSYTMASGDDPAAWSDQTLLYAAPHTTIAGQQISFDSGWVTVPNDARSFVKVSDRLTYYASVNGQFDVTSMMRWTS
jgi:hypothetical protein